MSRILTGIQSSGRPHLGNILGAMLPAIELSEHAKNSSMYFIADMHSLTSLKSATQRIENTRSVLAAWIALGFDYKKHTLFVQSHNPEVTELAWYLNCFTPFPMLANAHSFKDKSEKLSDVNAGLFTYPVLMAADILLYDVNLVPVGKDQLQHLEITRDIAKAFNNQYGDLLVIPDAYIAQEVKTIPGTDGAKMSKSYGNIIDVFLTEKELKKQVMSIVTDAKTLEEPKDPSTCNIFAVYEVVASVKQVAELRQKYIAGNFGYGHAKNELFAVLVEQYSQARKIFNELMQNASDLDAIAKLGSEKARAIGQPVLKRVKQAVGF